MVMCENETHVYMHTYISEPAIIRDYLPHATSAVMYLFPSPSLPLSPLFIVQPVVVVDLGISKVMCMEAGGGHSVRCMQVW